MSSDLIAGLIYYNSKRVSKTVHRAASMIDLAIAHVRNLFRLFIAMRKTALGLDCIKRNTVINFNVQFVYGGQ